LDASSRFKESKFESITLFSDKMKTMVSEVIYVKSHILSVFAKTEKG